MPETGSRWDATDREIVIDVDHRWAEQDRRLWPGARHRSVLGWFANKYGRTGAADRTGELRAFV